MTPKEIKKAVQRFVRDCKLTDIDYDQLCKAVETRGYTVVEFNTAANKPPVDTLLQALSLQKHTQYARGFTYLDSKYRLIFIHEDLSNDEKKIVIAHEIGHICCGHMKVGTIIGEDVRQEYEANEFMHFLCADQTQSTAHAGGFVRRNKKCVLFGLVLLAVLVIGVGIAFGVNKAGSYYGNYYITESGEKYHKAGCIFVKDKTNVHRMTKEEYESGEYAPCKICLPE